MGRHETFDIATPIADYLLAGTVLGRAPGMPLPEPGSAEAKAAFKVACHEHSVRTKDLLAPPELMHPTGGTWTAAAIGKALETGELTPAVCARLYPLATERELRMAEIEHELNLAGLFALAFADEYPVTADEPDTEEVAAARPPTVAPAEPCEPSLVGMLDIASASLDDLQSLYDLTNLVSSMAYAAVWMGRCKARGRGDEYNVAGKLMQWLGDALTDVETAANDEARRRRPANADDRETRLEILAQPVIQNGDPDETEAFARELLAHAAAWREGR